MGKMFKTEPFYSRRPWGYELWTLSTHRHGQSLVLPEKKSLLEVVGHPLPVLIKIIKADEALSVQVHPGDDYAHVHEHDNGKTECWYILEAREGASLIVGIEKGLTREKLADILAQGKLEEVVNYIPVQAGDMIYIPAGTVHAITGGIKLFEVQQSSDATYRMYDWGRPREMHIEKSLDVIDYAGSEKGGKIESFTTLETPYFRVEKVVLEGESRTWQVEEEFQTLNICHGSGTVSTSEQTLTLEPDETIYIPRGTRYSVQGNIELLRTW